MGTIYRVAGRRHWYIQWTDENGRRQKQSAGTSDKTTANQMLVAIEKKVAQILAGVVDVKHEQFAEYGKQPIQQWVDDYIAALEVANGKDNPHTIDTRAQIEKVIAHAGIRSGRELNMQHVIDYTSHRQQTDKLAARTIQSYITAMKSFASWCRLNNRLAVDPLEVISSPSIARDRRYERRAITREEWLYLRRSTLEINKERRLLPAIERVLLYELALVTGLRAKEILSLKRSSFVFGDQPYVMLPGADTKNSKPAEQSLTPQLAAGLEKHLARKLPSAPAFVTGANHRLGLVCGLDLEAARAAWISEAKSIDEQNRRNASDFLSAVDHAGKHVDFHALRYTCGAWLALAGIHAKQIQSIMRHSTIKLTLDTYGHLFPEQRTEAIAALAKATSY